MNDLNKVIWLERYEGNSYGIVSGIKNIDHSGMPIKSELGVNPEAFCITASSGLRLIFDTENAILERT